jgi:hypothetical protein
MAIKNLEGPRALSAGRVEREDVSGKRESESHRATRTRIGRGENE